MEKQKLADLVLQKMKEKKQQEEKNRPHYEVLRLEATFQKEIHDRLKEEIAQLQSLLNNERQVLNELQRHQNQLDNTGKKNYPRIVIMPDFIASEKISSSIKEFYRKTSNSFLRTDILRTKAYNESVEREKQFLQKLQLVEQLESQIRNNLEQDRKILNEKRIKVLKEDLRLRAIREEQKQIQRTIQKQKEQNKDLLNEYDIKKNNLQNRKDRLKYVEQQILVYKQKIEHAFNPVSYREHLQSVFDIQMKTQRMHNHLVEVVKKTGNIQKETEKYEKILQKTASLTVLGRTSDSPSTKRGRIQKRLQQERQKSKQNVRRPLSQRSSRSEHKRSQSYQSIKKQPLDLDLLKVVSTAKHSQRTTDRSSHPKLNSELAHSLF